MPEIIFPAYMYNPALTVVVGLLWLGCIALLFVPRIRRYSRGSSIFFRSSTPMGRGSRRAMTVRTIFVFSLLSIDLIANLRWTYQWVTVVELALLAVACASLLACLGLIFLNWPRFLSPSSLRTQPGAIQEWLGVGGKSR